MTVNEAHFSSLPQKPNPDICTNLRIKVYFVKWKCQGSDKSIWKRNKNPSEISTNSWKNIVEIRNLMNNFFVTHSDWNLCLRSRKNHKSMKRTKKPNVWTKYYVPFRDKGHSIVLWIRKGESKIVVAEAANFTRIVTV